MVSPILQNIYLYDFKTLSNRTKEGRRGIEPMRMLMFKQMNGLKNEYMAGINMLKNTILSLWMTPN